MNTYDKNFVKKDEEKKTFGGMIKNNFDISAPKGLNRATAVGTFNGWLYGITNLVSNNVSEQTLKLYAKTAKNQSKITNFKTLPVNLIKQKSLDIITDGSVEQLVNHPAQELLRTVNNYTDNFNLIYVISCHLIINKASQI